ncbi:MAG: glycosyltransferase [Acidimicrobiia bacterium]|nr:glycosyltransferase [Acidimicrobiia bacterium]
MELGPDIRLGRWRGPVSLVIGLMAVAGGNVAFHLLAGRFLGAAEYGSLSAMLAILVALAVPAGAIQVALTAEASRIDRRDRRIGFGPALVQFTAAGCLVASTLVVAGPWVNSYLGLGGAVSPLLVGLFFIPALAGLVLRSVLLGREHYLRLAVVLVGGTCLRLVGGAVLLSLRPTSGVALFTMLVSEVVTTLALLVAARLAPQPEAVAWDLRIRWSELVGGVVAFAGFWLVVGIDTVLARHHFVATEAGAYAAAALAARTVLYAPQSIITAALPRYSLEGAAARHALRASLVSSLVVGLCGVLVVMVAAEPLLELVLGQTYDVSAATVASLAVAALWAALLSALINYHLAKGSLLAANAPWLGFAVVVVGGNRVTGSVALSMLVLAAMLVAALAAAAPLIKPLARPAGLASRTPASLTPASLDLSIVVPVYNEGETVAATVKRIAEVTAGLLVSSEIIVVDDGSVDATSKSVEKLSLDAVRVLRLETNHGKGRAVRSGMASARGRVIGFIDGDGDIDPTHLRVLYGDLLRFGSDGTIGSKRHRGSIVTATRSRRALSTVGQLLTRWLFDVSVKDTQVGVKLFRREVVLDVLPRTKVDGYLFDLEFLAIAASRGWRHFIECPVRLRGNANSTIGPVKIVQTVCDLVAFACRLRFGSDDPTIRRPADQAAVAS